MLDKGFLPKSGRFTLYSHPLRDYLIEFQERTDLAQEPAARSCLQRERRALM